MTGLVAGVLPFLISSVKNVLLRIADGKIIQFGGSSGSKERGRALPNCFPCWDLLCSAFFPLDSRIYRLSVLCKGSEKDENFCDVDCPSLRPAALPDFPLWGLQAAVSPGLFSARVCFCVDMVAWVKTS